jgi:hypothetical protein
MMVMMMMMMVMMMMTNLLYNRNNYITTATGYDRKCTIAGKFSRFRYILSHILQLTAKETQRTRRRDLQQLSSRLHNWR